jgi:DNA transformation protein
MEVQTLPQLKRRGPVDAFWRIRQSGGCASLNLLWGLESSITGIHWREIARLHRTGLILELDDLERRSKKA